ncbi:MAG TPA: hypothetical protein VMF61_06540 [Candidatus Acidoferrales bacterium]|nr:hypothetical protein [Candidatus Acidoferrales bacterium]
MDRCVRSAIVAATAAVLSACGAAATMPASVPGSSPVVAPAVAAGTIVVPPGFHVAVEYGGTIPRAAKSPCQIQHMWYFRGGCSSASVKTGDGTTIALATYRGMTTADVTGPLDITAEGSGKAIGTLVVGEGTSRKDITGVLGHGSNARGHFPVYSKDNCLSASGDSEACPKPLLYFDNDNVGDAAIYFAVSPAITVIDKSEVGVQCQLGVMVGGQSQFYWLQPGLTGTFDRNGVLKIPPHSFGTAPSQWYKLPPWGWFATYAIGCNT